MKILHELSLVEWQSSIDINLTSIFLCLKYQLPALLAAGGGAVVVVSSTGAIKANPRICEYAAAKSGVLGLVRNAALEYGRQGIRVNAVLPGAVETPMFAKTLAKMSAETKARVAGQYFLGRWGQSQEIATTIRWLLSDEASFITGMTIPVDGGSTAG